jgi:hypothetical protein
MPLLLSIIAFPDGEDDVLSHDSRPPPDGAGSPRLRERRAYWQVGISIAHMFKLCKESCLRAAGISSPACKDGGFQTRSLVKSLFYSPGWKQKWQCRMRLHAGSSERPTLLHSPGKSEAHQSSPYAVDARRPSIFPQPHRQLPSALSHDARECIVNSFDGAMRFICYSILAA